MKRSFATVCNNDFLPGLVVLLYSMQRNVAEFDTIPFKVFWSPASSPVDETCIHFLQGHFPSVQFESADAIEYGDAPKVNELADNAAYLTLEAFGQREFDKVIFVDADMLCLRDFSEIWHLPHPFMACRAGGFQASGDAVNTGFFVVGKEVLNSSCYETLLSVAAANTHEVLRDQALINQYFRCKTVHILPDRYNYRTFDNAAHCAQNIGSIVFLHYSGYDYRPKPWEDTADQCVIGYRMWTEHALDLLDNHPDFHAILDVEDLHRKAEQLDAIKQRFSSHLSEFESFLARDCSRMCRVDREDYERARVQLEQYEKVGGRSELGMAAGSRATIYETVKLLIPLGILVAARILARAWSRRCQRFWDDVAEMVDDVSDPDP